MMNFGDCRGASLVEAALALTLLAGVLLGFWGLMQRLLILQRHQSALLQIAINPSDKFAKIEITSITDPVKVMPLSNAEASAVLSTLEQNLVYLVSSSGQFGAAPSSALVALAYVNVDAESGKIKLPDALNLSAQFYNLSGDQLPTGSACAGSVNSVLAPYLEKKLAALYQQLDAPSAPPIGTLIAAVPQGVTADGSSSALPQLSSYIQIKPLLVGVLCTEVGPLGSHVSTPFVMFPGKEVGL